MEHDVDLESIKELGANTANIKIILKIVQEIKLDIIKDREFNAKKFELLEDVMKSMHKELGSKASLLMYTEHRDALDKQNERIKSLEIIFSKRKKLVDNALTSVNWFLSQFRNIAFVVFIAIVTIDIIENHRPYAIKWIAEKISG